MKICPQCRQTYSDDGLNFCLNDGSVLAPYGSGPEARTVVADRVRVTNEFRNEPQGGPPAYWQPDNLQPPQYVGISPQAGNRDRSLAVISLLLGLFSLIPCFVIGIPLGIGGVVTGAIAIRNENSDPDRFAGRGLATGGIVMGVIGLAIGLLFLVLFTAG
jgi:hypothetical protein